MKKEFMVVKLCELFWLGILDIVLYLQHNEKECCEIIFGNWQVGLLFQFH
jgi:hypothetical protein